MSGQSYGPSIELCRLWSKTSKSGKQYLVGRLGGAKIVILPRDPETEGGPDHVVLLQEPSQRQQPRSEEPAQAHPEPPADDRMRRPAYAAPRRPRRDEPRGQLVDDAVPF